MRWLFADPSNEAESARVHSKLAAIDGWWKAFEARQSNIEGLFKRKSQWNLTKFMEDTLQAIDPRLMWEFGAAVRGPGHRLVITPESQRWLRPMVRTVLERAPKIAGWEFYPYRLAESVEQAIQTVKGRVGADISGALIEASVAPGRKVDLGFGFPGRDDLDEDTAQQAAFVATEALMGEQVLDTWIGAIDVLEDPPPAGSRLLSLDRAQATVAALIRGSLDQLPASRAVDISTDDDQWATVKLQPPEEANDYPARSDLIFALAHDVELFQAMHSGLLFSSSCHSKVGEQFCYLKLDGADVDRSGFAAFRSQFEDALNPALLTAGVGGCMGGGSGLRYAYIDLALTDLRHAVPIIRQKLTELRSPLRSWLLFHDDDLAAEWIGMYPQTPPPPGAGEA